MERVLECLVVLIQPLFYLLFLGLFIIFIIKPLFKILAVNKIINEQKVLQKEYQAHKEKVTQDRLAERAKREEKLSPREKATAD